jgi:3-hydroxymyristoyl/3-hydroxydecanoyl-(acyl carrier protein) dehydratase
MLARMDLSVLRQPLCIAADHPALPGHFPGNPVVPGVVLLDAVAAALERAWDLELRALPQVKFLRPLRPEEMAVLEIERGADALKFQIRAGAELIASGTLEAAP